VFGRAAQLTRRGLVTHFALGLDELAEVGKDLCAAQRHRRSRAGGARQRPAWHQITEALVAKQALMQLTGKLAGLHTEPGDEDPAQPAEFRECVDSPVALCQRGHQQHRQALAQRVLLGEALQGDNEVGGAAQMQSRRVQAFPGPHAVLGQLGNHAQMQRVGRNVAEWLAPPEGKAIAELPHRPVPVPADSSGIPPPDASLEPQQVKLVVLFQVHQVSRRPCHQATAQHRAEEAAQPHDVAAQRGLRAGRHGPGPHRLAEAVLGHWLVGPEQQGRQQASLPRRGYRYRLAAATYIERPQQAERHLRHCVPPNSKNGQCAERVREGTPERKGFGAGRLPPLGDHPPRLGPRLWVRPGCGTWHHRRRKEHEPAIPGPAAAGARHSAWSPSLGQGRFPGHGPMRPRTTENWLRRR
jgi:hypothetical protein